MSSRPLLTYSLLRMAAFVVPLAIMWIFPIMREHWWLTAILAALIGMSLSILFLRRPLSEASAKIYEHRTAGERAREDAIEDAANDAASHPGPQQWPG